MKPRWVILPVVFDTLPDFLAWIQPHALMLALVLPPVIRLVGHLVPEELFMVAMGVLAARSHSAEEIMILLGAVTLSHFVTDQATYLVGRWLRPRVTRFPWIASKLEGVTTRLTASRASLLWLIPARVLPLGRGAWMAGCGVVGIGWRRYAAMDLAALLVHLGAWSGLGWWLAYDLRRLQESTEMGRVVGMWSAAALVVSIVAFIAWRTRAAWQPAGARAVRAAGRNLSLPFINGDDED